MSPNNIKNRNSLAQLPRQRDNKEHLLEEVGHKCEDIHVHAATFHKKEHRKGRHGSPVPYSLSG